MRSFRRLRLLRLLLAVLVTAGIARAGADRSEALALADGSVEATGTVDAAVYPLAALTRGLAVLDATEPPALDGPERLSLPTAPPARPGAPPAAYHGPALEKENRSSHPVALRHRLCVYRL